MSRPARISYWVVIGMFFLVGWLHLGTPLLAALFSFFILEKLHWIKGKWLAVSVFAMAVLGLSYGAAHFIKQAGGALTAVKEQRENLDTFARFANNAARQLAFLIIGIVVAVSVFLNNKLDLDHG